MPRWLRNLLAGAKWVLARLPTVALAALLGFGVAFLLYRDAGPALKSADIPPAEYVHLDSGRVLAYLGQIEGGLSDAEKRTRTRTEKLNASLTAKGAEIGGASEQTLSSEQTVSQTEADRFFRLLRTLRDKDTLPDTRPLAEFDGQLPVASDPKVQREKLNQVEEGDFVRIKNARLFLPPYAAVYPRARYASSFLRGGFKVTRERLVAPVSRLQRREVQAYLRSIGPNARLPFVAPTLRGARRVRRAVTFLVPVRYQDLGKEPSLLSGNVEVLGKLVYKDARLASEVPQADPIEPSYLDRQSLATFGPSLSTASPALLERLSLSRGTIARRLRASVTFPAPVAVVVPVAIYK